MRPHHDDQGLKEGDRVLVERLGRVDGAVRKGHDDDAGVYDVFERTERTPGLFARQPVQAFHQQIGTPRNGAVLHGFQESPEAGFLVGSLERAHAAIVERQGVVEDQAVLASIAIGRLALTPKTVASELLRRGAT